ncbi:MAG: hypothetical protein D3904_09620, partial [Candidatus Electrothrix sp. EH2]|nr:hypothetical protein [Candidatus Electrothrix sp. EH2]
FVRNLKRYSSCKARIRKKAERILDDPYRNTESLVDAAGWLNLKGCRSSRIDRNFRIVFVICEEAAPSRTANSASVKIFPIKPSFF